MSIIDFIQAGQKRSANPKSDASLGKVLAIGIPIILMAMRTKTQDDGEAKQLGEALKDHESRRTGDAFERINQADVQDGDKILGHVLGSNKDRLIKEIAAKTGVAEEDVKTILSQASPNLMEEVAAQTKDDRSPAQIREVTERELKKVQQEAEMPDLFELAKGMASALGGQNANNIGDLLKRFL